MSSASRCADLSRWASPWVPQFNLDLDTGGDARVRPLLLGDGSGGGTDERPPAITLGAVRRCYCGFGHGPRR